LSPTDDVDTEEVVPAFSETALLERPTTTVIFARDGGKSVRAELTSAGAVRAAFRYRAYGQIQAAFGASTTILSSQPL
jgi:hypothetical protein